MGRVYNKVNDQTDVAVGLKHNFQDNSDKISIGGRYRHSDNLTVKAKVRIQEGSGLK